MVPASLTQGTLSPYRLIVYTRKLEMQKEAKVFFREVVESFPKSESAKVAHKLLAVSPDQKAPQ